MTVKQLLILFSPFCFCLSGYIGIWYYCAPQKVYMPHLVGSSLESAIAVASSEGLALQIAESRESDHYESTTILFQSPAPGAQGKQGQAIYVTISKKTEPSYAPHFVGKRRDEIEAAASKMGLYLDTHLISGGAKEGFCCAQWPEMGMPIVSNSVIVYCVKPVDQLVVMPAFKGRNLADLLLFLSERAIEWRLFGIEDRKIDYADYVVRDQRPTQGSMVSYKKGLVVDLQVEKQKL